MRKLHIYILSSFLIISLATILGTNLKHDLYTLFQAASRMKTSHEDYKLFPKINLIGNPNLKNIPRKLISYDKEKYNFNKKYHIETLMILKDNNIIVEEYYNKNTEKSQFNLFSATKTIISFAIGILQDRNLLNINDLVSKYLDWSPFKNATIKNVLEMSSGYSDPLIHWYLDMAFDYFAYNLTDRCKNYPVNDKLIPGTLYRYSNLNTQILSEIIKKVSGVKTHKFIQYNLYNYIAKNNAIWSTDRVYNIKAFCCLFLNTEDFLRFGKLILDKGKVNGKQIISEKYINDMFTPNDELFDSEYPEEKNDFYGLQAWTMMIDGVKMDYFCGLQGQYTFVFEDYNMVVTMFATDEKAGGRTYNQPIQRKIVREIKEMLGLK